MAARTRRIRHDEETRRFYVYALLQDGVAQYIGKGSGRRILVQERKFNLAGVILRWFSSESASYKFERAAIKEHRPPLNKSPGGDGSRAKRRRRAVLKEWSRADVARFLMRFDLTPHLPQSSIDQIRLVAMG